MTDNNDPQDPHRRYHPKHHPQQTHHAHDGKDVDLGLMHVTLSEALDGWSESAISVHITSQRHSLLEPELHGMDAHPSAADLLVLLIKQALVEKGITVIEQTGNSGSTTPEGVNKKTVSVMDFNSHNFDQSDALIRTDIGYYKGELHAKQVVDIAAQALEKIAPHLKGALTATAMEERINTIYRLTDVAGRKLEDALNELTHAGDVVHSQTPALKSPQAQLVAALQEKIAGDASSQQQRDDAVAAITEDLRTWKTSEDKSVQGTPADPLHGEIRKTLAAHNIGPSDDARAFYASELCDAVYEMRARRQGEQQGR